MFGRRRRRQKNSAGGPDLVGRLCRAREVLEEQRFPPEVEADVRACLDEAERSFEYEPELERIAVRVALFALSMGLLITHRGAEAERAIRRLRELAGPCSSDDFPARVGEMLGRSVALQGRHEEALGEFTGCEDLLVAQGHPLDGQLRVRAFRAIELCHLRRFEEAELLAGSVITDSAHLSAPQEFTPRWRAASALSCALTRQGRPGEGESTARDALAAVAAQHMDNTPLKYRLAQNLAHALNAQGHHAQALDLITSARAAYTATPDFPPALAATGGVCATEALLGLGRTQQAAEEARTTLTALTESYGPGHGYVRDAQELLDRM